ncbi:hypothetical protein [Candidatus Mesenet endosymbiont of Agriotes lineatus]|uniref:hypothetical protein n=1 Tax=Candidatus Mesenet endosymbiont of Agriotes lineatus TaxID=3077948 RepID=UPI0030CD1E0D
MVDLIQKCKSAIPSKIRRLCSKIKFDKPKHYLLVRQNDKLNYRLIKYIWWKNFYSQAENEQLRHNYSENNNNQDECNTQLFLGIVKRSEDASSKLSSKIKKRLKAIDNINILLSNGGIFHKKQIHKALEASRMHCKIYNACYHGLAQQEWFSSFVKKNLRVILSQGKLERTKITDQEADKLIKKNEKVLRKVEKHSGNRQQKISLETRKIIFKEIKEYIITLKMQQLQQELNEVKDEALKCVEGVITRRQSLKILLEKTKNLKEAAKEFFSNTKIVRHETANNKIFYYALTVVATIVVTALICYCIYTTFSKPSQSLDNVALMQNVGKLINSIT